MLITIEIDKDAIIKKSSLFLKKLLTFGYKWLTTDGEFLGYILAVLHITIGIGALVAIILSHTIYPSFWLQFMLTSFVGIVAIQHVLLKVCIVTIVEKELTQSISPFIHLMESLLKKLNIDYSTFINNIVLAEVIFVLTSILGLISRISVYLHRFSF